MSARISLGDTPSSEILAEYIMSASNDLQEAIDYLRDVVEKAGYTMADHWPDDDYNVYLPIYAHENDDESILDVRLNIDVTWLTLCTEYAGPVGHNDAPNDDDGRAYLARWLLEEIAGAVAQQVP